MKKRGMIICILLFLFLMPVIKSYAAEAEESVAHIELKETAEYALGRETETSVIQKIESGDLVLIVNNEYAARQNMEDVKRTSSVTLTVGEEVYYEGWFTCYFYVNGNLAYCLEPLKNTPGAGNYTEELSQNPLLGKALYYLYGGPGYNEVLAQSFFGEYNGDMSMIYGLSHAVVSYIYEGERMDGGALTGLSDYGKQKVQQITEAIRNMREPASADIEIVPRERKAFYAGEGLQQTEVQTLRGDERNSIQINLPDQVTLHHAGNGMKETKTATIQGGESFYFTAPTSVMGMWSTNALCGALRHNYKAFIINKNEETQTVGGWMYSAVGEQGETELQIEWLPPIEIKLQKLDKEENIGESQGSGTLEGAVYHIIDTQNQIVDIMKTDKQGMATSKKLPKKEYIVKEVEAPEGYLLNKENIVVSVMEKNASINSFQIQSMEEVIRGDVEIIKFGQDKTGEEGEIKKPLEGIEFTLTSKTTGNKYTIVTDKNGRATTKQLKEKRGGLVYDTYILEETKGKKGFKPIEPLEIQVKKEGETLHYIAENKRIRAAVCIQKVDADTGKIIPVKGAEFEILDEDGNPVIMYTYYPNKQEHRTFVTDENGQFLLPDPLDQGKYRLVEVKAPEGYLIGEPMEFEIDKANGYEEPLLIRYENKSAKGKIRIHKIDKETKHPLGQVEFEIIAKEDIVTPDGTIRMKKGESVQKLSTDELGSAVTDEIFLGEYEIKETRALEGYIKKDKPEVVLLSYKGQDIAVAEMEITITNMKLSSKVPSVKTGDMNGKLVQSFLVMAVTAALAGLLLALHHYIRK